LSPAEFRGLTLGEFFLLREAYIRRQEEEMERFAWLATAIEYCSRVKKIPSIDRLLGKQPSSQQKNKTAQKEEIDWLKKRFEKNLNKRMEKSA